MSARRRRQNAEYTKRRKAYLAEFRYCQVEGCGNTATQIHHRNHRHGARLIETRYFLAVCSRCHNKIHNNPAWARERGLLI